MKLFGIVKIMFVGVFLRCLLRRFFVGVYQFVFEWFTKV